MLAVQAEGSEVRTVESLSRGGALNNLQESFRVLHALQCGFCTAGILMSLTELLENQAGFDEHVVRRLMRGHLCRCTGYETIVDAVLALDSSSGPTPR